ncbi:hypothetical protein THRCLA_11633 [Thraustotheca clavata]|uniref:Kinase n=1 Tax=Thraustotheca clavata TaxID=74557 RepID=A0A1V9Y761_9STRA|nr:hypothetical protein THRCLA_11633 [Thraustotheca clavata]
MWKQSGSIVGKTTGLDDLPLALQQDVNDFVHFTQNRKQQKLVPRINKVDFIKAMTESEYVVCLQLQVLTKDYQEGWPIAAMTTSIANMSLSTMTLDRGKFTIAVRIPKLYPNVSPDVSCVTGGENVPIEMKRGANFVLPWLQNGWPTEYSLTYFAEDLCRALEAPEKIPTASFIAEQHKVFPLQMNPEHLSRHNESQNELTGKTIATSAPTNADLLIFSDIPSAPKVPKKQSDNPFASIESPNPSPHTSRKMTTPPTSLPKPLVETPPVPTQDLLDLSAPSNYTPPAPVKVSPRNNAQSPRTPSFESGYHSNECYIKCKWNGEARRFAFDRSLSFSQLQESIRRLFQIPTATILSLVYLDSDGDKCLLSSDEELRAALSHYPHTLVLHINTKTEEATSVKTNATSSTAVYNKVEDVSLREIKIEDVKLEKCIGVGSSCKVYKAIWRGTEVAIKKFTSQNAETVNKEFKHEVQMMSHLGCHPCIVLLLAVCRTPKSIIFEYLPFSLFEQINGSQDPTKKIPPFPNTWQKRLQMIMDVARGLQFLHSFNIVHRDLKSLNLLITDEGRVKLADFGIAKVENEFMTRCCGTYQWMAPEVIVSQSYSVSADIYSFGVVMWEICEASVPFADTPAALVAMAVIQENKRPAISPNIPNPLKELITKCWDKDANIRPDAATIVTSLTNFLQASQATSTG